MPRLVLQLHYDLQSGRRAVYADLFSDEDMVAFEHEQQHKELVDRLVEGGALKAAREGRVVVERAEDMTPVFLAGG